MAISRGKKYECSWKVVLFKNKDTVPAWTFIWVVARVITYSTFHEDMEKEYENHGTAKTEK